MRLWNVKERAELFSLKNRASVYCLGFSPNGETIGYGSFGVAAFLAASDPKKSAVVVEQPKSVWALAFHPKGKIAATGGMNNAISTVAYDRGGRIDTWLKPQRFAVRALAFSPDGKILASGGADKSAKDGEGPSALSDGEIHFWAVGTGKKIATLRGHTHTVFSLAFSPDGKWLASGSSDKTLRLWDAAAAKEVAVLRDHSDSVRCVAFSPDGKMLASGSYDRTVKIWSVPP